MERVIAPIPQMRRPRPREGEQLALPHLAGPARRAQARFGEAGMEPTQRSLLPSQLCLPAPAWSRAVLGVGSRRQQSARVPFLSSPSPALSQGCALLSVRTALALGHQKLSVTCASSKPTEKGLTNTDHGSGPGSWGQYPGSPLASCLGFLWG